MDWWVSLKKSLPICCHEGISGIQTHQPAKLLSSPLFHQPIFAFEYGQVFPENGWKVYDAQSEYKRQVRQI